MKLLSSLTSPRNGFNVEIGLRAALHRARRAFHTALYKPDGPVDLFLCIVDHFEPQHGRPPRAVSRERMEDWLRRYPRIAAEHQDADGRSPAHGFFYPWDEFDEWEFARLTELCAGGWGEIDLHLHHKDDTEESLEAKIREALDTYRRYGALSEWPDGTPAYGFIHGNWALNNSRSEGGQNHCGVNDEITLLKRTGCYADFTFPAWRHTAQPRQVNCIYYARSSSLSPKGHDSGRRAGVGQSDADGLLLIQGPLIPYLERKGFLYKPGVDDSDLASYRRYGPERLDRWVRAGLQIQGRPDRIFIKLHCHGAPDANRRALLDGDFHALFADAESRYNDGQRYRLHYTTAREMFNVIQATVDDVKGEVASLRDYLLKPPAVSAACS